MPSVRDLAFGLGRREALLARLENRIATLEEQQNVHRRSGVTIGELPPNLDFGEYVLDTNPLTANDAGPYANINIAPFRAYWPDRGQGVNYSGFILEGLAYATEYSVYVDDPLRRGGILDCDMVGATTVKVDLNRFRKLGRLFIGKITTPAQGAGDTTGTPGGTPAGGSDPPPNDDNPGTGGRNEGLLP